MNNKGYIAVFSIALAAVFFANLIYYLFKRKNYRIFRPVITFKLKYSLLSRVLELILISTVIEFPRFYVEKAGYDSDFLKSVLYSFYDTIRLFGFNGELEQIRVLKRSLLYFEFGNCFTQIIVLVEAALYVLAPVFTVVAVLSIFKELTAKIRYFVESRISPEVYIFSELNEKSVTIAESINNRKGKKCIVFTDVFNDNGETDFELLNRAECINAICFKSDITSHYWLSSLSRVMNKGDVEQTKYNFFIISDDENENCTHTISLIDKYDRRTRNTEIYLFSKSSISELAIHNKLDEKSTIVVKRIDYKRSIVYNYLYEYGYDIINNAQSDGKKEFNILIVGAGDHSTEMLKALLWFCQRDDFKLTVNVYDKRDDIDKEFYSACPSFRNNDKYCIEFHGNTDIMSDELDLCDKPNFVFVSLGSDNLNIIAAKKISENLEYSRIVNLEENSAVMPIIVTVVENSLVAQSLEKNTYGIRFIGDYKSTYKYEAIMNPNSERIAKKLHLKWKSSALEVSDFYKEYNYRSNIAQVAYHRAWKCYCDSRGMLDKSFLENVKALAEKKQKLEKEQKEKQAPEKTIEEIYNEIIEELSQEQRDLFETLTMNEKQRWSTYMMTEGYQPVSNEVIPVLNENEMTHIKKHLHHHAMIDEYKNLSRKEQIAEQYYFIDAFNSMYNTKASENKKSD